MSALLPDWEQLFKNNKIDVCINAAGNGNVSNSITYPLLDFRANSLEVICILDAIRLYNPECKYLHISSAAVYGNPKQLPIKEDDKLAPLSPYGYHKLMSEIICKEYYHLYNLPITIIRPFSVYGNGLKKQLFWDICEKQLRNKNIILFGTGKETRDFLHISDLLQLINVVIENSAFKCDIYNAATGIETTIKQIADIFWKNFPKGKKIGFSGELKKGDPLNWRADISRVNKLGFEPKIKLNDTIIDYINWYCNLVNE